MQEYQGNVVLPMALLSNWLLGIHRGLRSVSGRGGLGGTVSGGGESPHDCPVRGSNGRLLAANRPLLNPSP
jgi:hypothetical protein